MLDPVEWDFDRVPDSELVACCYWEYARESSFIRRLRERCLENWKAGGPRDEKLYADTDKLQSIGYASEVIICGFYSAPDDPHKDRHPHAPPITGSFPAPWQSLDKAERGHRGRIRIVAQEFRIAPVGLGHWSMSKLIARHWQGVADQQHEQQKAWEHEYLRRDTKGNFYTLHGAPEPPHFEPIRPALTWGFSETLLVDIAWECFTNDEIANYFRRWVKHARPKTIPQPNDKGRKVISWRVALERLGIVRLLHRFPLRELSTECPAAWKRYGTANRR